MQLFEDIFSGAWGYFDRCYIFKFQEKLNQYSHNFIPLGNNKSKVNKS